jgi:hypothetical protein
MFIAEFEKGQPERSEPPDISFVDTHKDLEFADSDALLNIHSSETDVLHWKEDPIYVFPEMKLYGLVPNFHIHLSVSDLCIYSDQDPPAYLAAAK